MKKLALIALITGGLFNGSIAWGQAGYTSTAAGDGSAGYGGDGSAATSATINRPRAIAIDPAGNIYFADEGNNRIRKISPAGIIVTVAGTGTAGYGGDGGPATSAQLNAPYGVALDSIGNLYIADLFNQRIRKVTSSGTISTVAGNGTGGYTGDGGLATSAQIWNPTNVRIDKHGN